jgi:hypothetical protein
MIDSEWPIEDPAVLLGKVQASPGVCILSRREGLDA